MPRQIISEDLVKTTADAILSEGGDPSMVNVQARIGGGSYTTVKKFLDLWRSNRSIGDMASIDLPPEVEAKGKEFVLATWTLAKQISNKEAQAAKDVAASDVAAVRLEIAQALQEIARLEESEAQRIEAHARQEKLLREIEIALADSQAQARRSIELGNQVKELQKELKDSQKDAIEKASQVGKLSGEAEALRKQVADLMATLKAFGQR